MSDILTVILGIGAVQSILFALLIIMKQEKRLADWILLGWFFIFSFHLSLGISRGVSQTNVAKIFTMTISFLHGPLFLCYTKAILSQRLTKTDFLHGLPFVIFTCTSFFVEQSAELLWEITILIAKIISLTLYPLYILYFYHKKRFLLITHKVEHSLLKLSWIKVIAVLFLMSIGISLVRLSTELWIGVAYFEIWDALRYVILLTVIGFYGLKYGMVYQPEIVAVVTSADEKKYKHSPLKNQEIKKHVELINRFFQENEAYLSSDFSLAILSKAVEIPKHHLSQIINATMQTTFYDLLNTKRIEYAMKRLKEGGKLYLTLEGLGYECGFNSKSAFFYHFKKNTGKTPGQFKKEISTA